MKTNKILLAGLAGAVLNFFLGWLVYGMLLYDFITVPAEVQKKTNENVGFGD